MLSQGITDLGLQAISERNLLLTPIIKTIIEYCGNNLLHFLPDPEPVKVNTEAKTQETEPTQQPPAAPKPSAQQNTSEIMRASTQDQKHSDSKKTEIQTRVTTVTSTVFHTAPASVQNAQSHESDQEEQNDNPYQAVIDEDSVQSSWCCCQ